MADEVRMTGGRALFWIALLGFALVTAVVWAEDSAASASTSPPAAKITPVEEMLHGHKIVDNYRWLEDAQNPETKAWVEQELAYTRGMLDALPGREQIQKRLEQLLTIGNINPPQMGGRYYFYTRRDGMQNQPVLYVREGVEGSDRVLVDANQLASDGTIALDWWYASDDGKYVAYGLSPSGSEMSTLHVIETAAGKALPETIERTRAASVAWKPDNSGFYYTRYPKKGDVAEGQEMYNRHVFYHALGTDPAKDPLVFGEGLNPEFWPNVTLSEDGRWLLISLEEGWTKSELYLADVKAGTAPVRITDGKEFLYSGDFLRGKIYVTTNEDAPRYRLFVVDAANPARAHWKELIPQSDAVLQGASVFGEKLYAQYEKNRPHSSSYSISTE
jgi:prolyl oligopeptidase